MVNIDINQIMEIVVGVSFVTAHLIAIFGVPKFLPAQLVQVLNVLAANYKNAKNLPAQPRKIKFDLVN